MTDQAELKLCAHCDGEAIIVVEDRVWVECADCPSKAECGPFDTEAEAIAAWNTRADTDLALCTCAEIAGEDPECAMHGKGTLWAKENPDVCELADRMSDLTRKLRVAEEALKAARLGLACKRCDGRGYVTLALGNDECPTCRGDNPSPRLIAKIDAALADIREGE